MVWQNTCLFLIKFGKGHQILCEWGKNTGKMVYNVRDNWRWRRCSHSVVVRHFILVYIRIKLRGVKSTKKKKQHWPRTARVKRTKTIFFRTFLYLFLLDSYRTCFALLSFIFSFSFSLSPSLFFFVLLFSFLSPQFRVFFGPNFHLLHIFSLFHTQSTFLQFSSLFFR